MYAIYPFLKSGRVGVNSTDENLYIGNSKGEPVQLVTELNSTEIIKTVIEEVSGGGGGGSTIVGVANEIPRKEALVVGNIVQFSGNNWIVVHTTETEAYLTLTDVLSARYYIGTFSNNQVGCYRFAGRNIGTAEKRWLKPITAGNTNGIVFIATYDQMNGGFSYFNSNIHRAASEPYLTSTLSSTTDDDGTRLPYGVTESGGITGGFADTTRFDLRPSVCIDLTAYENGPAENPYDLPPLSQIALGNTITWANHEWIVVSTPTESICYLTLAELDGVSTWNELNNTCTAWSSANFTEVQLASLTSVTAGNTSGKVFVATAEQMNGDFSYFNSNDRRKMDQSYWTSTDYGIVVKRPEYVDATGAIAHDNNDATGSMGFRPSIALNMWLYNWI